MHDRTTHKPRPRRLAPVAFPVAGLIVAVTALGASVSMPPNLREDFRPDAVAVCS